MIAVRINLAIARRYAGATALLAAAPFAAAAPQVAIGSAAEQLARTRELRGDTVIPGFLLRSPSSVAFVTNDTSSRRGAHWAPLMPELRLVYNSALPFSMNDGALWAGRGLNTSVTGGLLARYGPVRLRLAPEIVYSANQPYALTGPPFNPEPPPSRHPMSSPWHAGPQSIDLPMRFGEAPVRRLHPGQSSIAVDVGRATLGAGTESSWWGPGLRNALILSNHAPGFYHLFARPVSPVETRAGILDARWIVGWLRESPYFDVDISNELRSISALAITWQPPAVPGFTAGVARSVFAPTASRSDALRDFWQVFADVGHPNARPASDSTITPGRDQLYSLFFRWVLPDDGFETWVEWARTELPVSFRDLLVFPNHTQGYTLGLHWLGDTLRWNARLRAQAEFTYLEQSTTFRFRPIGSWYTSRAVVQGYTNRGQSLGAAIGPGSSSQWLALDYMMPAWQFGVFFNRIRWLEDAHSQQPYPDIPEGSRGWCEHDVSMLPGVRGAVRSRFGDLAAEFSSGWRLNVFFENAGPCPISPGRDVRNKSFSLTFTPVAF